MSWPLGRHAWQFLVKLNVPLPCDPTILLTAIYLREISAKSHGKTHASRFIPKSPISEISRMSIHRRMDEQISHHGILRSSKKGGNSDTHSGMDAAPRHDLQTRKQTQKSRFEDNIFLKF